MAYIGKVFKLNKIDKLADVLLETGIPEESVKKFVGGFSGDYTVKIDNKSDSSYTFTNSANGQTKTTTIEFNKDIDETFGEIKYQSFYTVSGDVIKHAIKLPTGKTLIVTRNYSANKIEGTAQVEGGSKVCTFGLTPQ